MTFTRTFIGTLAPSLIAALMFAFALEGLATYSQCLLVSIGLFLIVNCAVTLSTQSRGLVFMTDVNKLMEGIDLSSLGEDDE